MKIKLDERTRTAVVGSLKSAEPDGSDGMWEWFDKDEVDLDSKKGSQLWFTLATLIHDDPPEEVAEGDSEHYPGCLREHQPALELYEQLRELAPRMDLVTPMMEEARISRLDNQKSIDVADEVLLRPECGAWGVRALSALGPEFMKTGECEHTRCRPKGFTPRYASNMGACMEVVEHLQDRGVDFDIQSRGSTWTVRLVWHEGSEVIQSQRLESFTCGLPSLICEAALDWAAHKRGGRA